MFIMELDGMRAEASAFLRIFFACLHRPCNWIAMNARLEYLPLNADHSCKYPLRRRCLDGYGARAMAKVTSSHDIIICSARIKLEFKLSP